MKIGVNTYPYLWKTSLPDAFRSIRAMGITEVEILASPPQLWPRALKVEERLEIQRTMEETGIRLVALNPPGQDINMASPHPDMRAYTVDIYKQLIDLAFDWKAPFIVMPPGRLHPLLPPDFEWVWKQCKPDFLRLIDYAERHGVTLLLENIPSLFLQTAEEIAWAIDDLGSNRIGAIYDVANGFMSEDPAKGIAILREKIKLVHLSDTTRRKWEHNKIGDGDVDFFSVYKALREIEYEGACLLEIIHPDATEGIESSIETLKAIGWDVHV